MDDRNLTLDFRRREPTMLMAGSERDKHADRLAEISSGLVRLHRRYYGKGPTQAGTHVIDDTVVCLLHGGFTTIERTLIDEGRAGDVHRIRHSFQIAMQERFTQIVEGATGRRVIAYMSQVHHDPDMAVELFVLESAIEETVIDPEKEPSVG